MSKGGNNTDDGFFRLEKNYKSKDTSKEKVVIVAPSEQIVEQAKLKLKKRKITDQLS